MNRQRYRVVLVYTDEYMVRLKTFGPVFDAEWRVYNTYNTRAGARGQTTQFLNKYLERKPEHRRYKAVRVEEWDADNGNWEVLDERSIA